MRFRQTHNATGENLRRCKFAEIKKPPEIERREKLLDQNYRLSEKVSAFDRGDNAQRNRRFSGKLLLYLISAS